jgi:cytoskeletal protein RodZ
MNRDVLTTVGGLVLVGIVVVATFLYGNEQRQAQLRRDQTAQRQSQQQSKNQSTPKASSVSTSSGSSNTATATSSQPAVQKPSSSNQTTLQGGSPSSTASSPVPSSGSGPAETPRTGSSSILYVFGATLMVVLYQVYRRSRTAVAQAALNTVRTRSSS